MRNFRARKPIRKILIAVSTASAVAMLLSSPGSASTGGSSPLLRYEYSFANTKGTVVNSAPHGPVAPLTLKGSWSSVKGGVKFSGNTTGDESVAYGQPHGYTLDVPRTAAIGFGARILYEPPAHGKCFPGTPNITQIGLYDAKPVPAQAKLQLSGCQTSATKVTAECRFAGSLTTTADPPVASALPLVGGQEYNITCIKSPDHGGKTAITLNVTPVKTGHTTTNTFSVAAIGYLRTKQYISVGNVYPLPAAKDNTNQFNGDMYKTVYCTGTSAHVSGCLATSLPVK
jgi:hypothetical protein